MKTIRADIGNSGELHKMLVEYSKDMKQNIPSPDFWLIKFSDPTFFCFLAKHGKKPVGFLLGNFQPYYDQPIANIDSVFMRRGFRGKIKFTRSFMEEVKEMFEAFKISVIAYNRIKSRERAI